jgi:hypothetical protein
VLAEALEMVRCQADVGAGTVLCRPDDGPESAGSTARILGGQGTNVRLVSTNVAYDSVAEIFRMDVSVQNLLAQRMGTPDGTSVTGVTVFFHSDPVVVGGAGGAVSVRNADGEGFFTGGAQAYFQYPQVLALNASSTARRWEFSCSRGVGRFTFLVYVRADLLPVVVFDQVVGGNRDIWRVALDGSDLVRLTTNTGDDRNPTAGGNRVVYSTFRFGNAELFSVPLAGGAETRLTTSAASEGDPALSYDGRRLAYTSDASVGVSKVWVAEGNGTGAARATPVAFGSNGSPEAAPSWGPLNDRVALVGTPSGSADIYGMVLGGAPLLLAGGGTAEVNPAWSPDGRFVAYATNATGAGDVYVVAVEGGRVTRVTSGAESEVYPTWLLDGRLVYLRSVPAGGKELRWVDPAAPQRNGVIPLPAGTVPDRPYAVAF